MFHVLEVVGVVRGMVRARARAGARTRARGVALGLDMSRVPGPAAATASSGRRQAAVWLTKQMRHACGQVASMNRSLEAHSPAAAHASQAESSLLHAADSHRKQDLRRKQAGSGFGRLALRRLLSAPDQAPGRSSSGHPRSAAGPLSRHGARLAAGLVHEGGIRAALTISGPGAAAVVGVHALVRWRSAP